MKIIALGVQMWYLITKGLIADSEICISIKSLLITNG